MSFFRKLKIKFMNRWRDNKFKKRFLLILFWLSILSIYMASYLDGFVSSKIDDITGFKYTGHIFLLFSSIPIMSLIMGIYYKRIGYLCKKNIIGGAIMSLIMIMATFSGFFSYYTVKDKYFDDYSYLTDLESIVNFDFPDNGDILIDKAFNFEMDDYNILAHTTVTFSNKDEINKFNNAVGNSSNWIGKKSSYQKMLEPTFFTSQSDYYMIYIKDLNLYNEVPVNSGIYHMYYLEYNIDEAKLNIYEYNLNFSN